MVELEDATLPPIFKVGKVLADGRGNFPFTVKDVHGGWILMEQSGMNDSWIHAATASALSDGFTQAEPMPEEE